MLRRHKRVSGGVKVYQKMKSSFFDCFYVMPPLTNGGHYTRFPSFTSRPAASYSYFMIFPLHSLDTSDWLCRICK